LVAENFSAARLRYELPLGLTNRFLYDVQRDAMILRSLSHKILVPRIATAIIICFFTAILPIISTATAFQYYTEKQMTALADRVGKTYWTQKTENRTPLFLSAPNAAATSFTIRAGESFAIVGLVGREKKNPYYKVMFDSGKEGYLSPQTFLEELNLTILSIDPLADEKRRAAEQAEEEKKRVAWINAQPWPAAAKQAALKGHVLPGMNREEVKRVAGAPSRVRKAQRRDPSSEEHWVYPDGKELIFRQGLLVRTILKDNPKP
jgi:hypothetical protein